MARMLDVILLATLVALFAALALYKVILLFCYRNDPAKREALISSGQVYPKRLRKFIFEEDAHTSDKKSSPLNSVSK